MEIHKFGLIFIMKFSTELVFTSLIFSLRCFTRLLFLSLIFVMGYSIWLQFLEGLFINYVIHVGGRLWHPSFDDKEDGGGSDICQL